MLDHPAHSLMLLHQLELDSDDLTLLKTEMDALVRECQPSSGFWSKWWYRVWKKAYPEYTIRHWTFHNLPKAVRNRFLVLAYKYLDRIPGATYSAPQTLFGERDAFVITRVHAPGTVRIESYLPMHRDNQFLERDVVTVVFHVHKNLQGCHLRVRLPGDCARILPIHEGVVMVVHGEVLHGITAGCGPGVRESVAVHLPEHHE